MKAQLYFDHLASEGKFSFTKIQLQRQLKLTNNATDSLLSRLKHKKHISSPVKGYFLIIPPEFRNLDCLPPDFFINDLMHYLQTDYYVSLLSAALYHGAAHQQPQIFQVMIPTAHRDIKCGNVKIKFIKNQILNTTPVMQLKTRTGFFRVSTPEGTAKDLLNFISQSGGMGQIITVMDELAESLNRDKLKKLAMESHEPQWIQRLGYLLETLGYKELSEILYSTIEDKKLRIIPLVPNRNMTGVSRDKKWRIAVNTTIKSDLDDDTY
jgi:predicted transcriptional regulator of viral defense system